MLMIKTIREKNYINFNNEYDLYINIIIFLNYRTLKIYLHTIYNIL